MIRFHFYVEFENKTKNKQKKNTNSQIQRRECWLPEGGVRWAKWVKGIRRQTFQLQSEWIMEPFLWNNNQIYRTLASMPPLWSGGPSPGCWQSVPASLQAPRWACLGGTGPAQWRHANPPDRECPPAGRESQHQPWENTGIYTYAHTHLAAKCTHTPGLHVHMYKCTHAHVHTRWEQQNTHTRQCVHMYTHTQMRVQTQNSKVHTHRELHVCMYKCTHTHVHTH